MRLLIAMAALTVLTSVAHAQQAEKQPLDHKERTLGLELVEQTPVP